MGILSVIFRRHFSPYKMYVRRDVRLGVLLNPKVGSTSFRETLFEGLQKVGSRPRLGKLWPMRLERRYFTAPVTDYWDALSRPDHYRFYCFVRNPYARVLSAWKDKIAFGYEVGSFPRSMGSVIGPMHRFARQRNLPGHTPGQQIPFATFIAFIESQAEGTRNQHWDTQRSVLFSDVIRYHRVIRLENEFADGMSEILTQLGMPADWIVERVRHTQNASRKLTEPAFDAELAARVERVYSADFDQFGYARDSWQGL